jgi:hypothetical protein
MGSDTDEYYGGERPGRKPSLQARLQSGMYVHLSVTQPDFCHLVTQFMQGLVLG